MFTRALANLPGFIPAEPAGLESRHLEGWLLAIARNAIVDQARANRRLTILDPIAYRDQLIDRNYLAREGEPQGIRPRASWRHSEWLRAEAARLGIPTLPARPWETVVSRAIALLSDRP